MGIPPIAAQAHPQSFVDLTLQEQWIQTVQPILGSTALDLWDCPSQFINGHSEISSHLQIWTAADLQRHQHNDPTGSLSLIYLDDTPSPAAPHAQNGFKHSWNEALRMLNLYQFLPHSYAITTTAVQAGQQPLRANPPPRKSVTPAAPTSEDHWATLSNLVLEPDLLPILDIMKQEHWPLPIAGYEISNDRGKVIAETELAWPEERVAILSIPDDQAACTQAGWFTLTVEAVLADLNPLRERLKGA